MTTIFTTAVCFARVVKTAAADSHRLIRTRECADHLRVSFVSTRSLCRCPSPSQAANSMWLSPKLEPTLARICGDNILVILLRVMKPPCLPPRDSLLTRRRSCVFVCEGRPLTWHPALFVLQKSFKRPLRVHRALVATRLVVEVLNNKKIANCKLSPALEFNTFGLTRSSLAVHGSA
jgi:hypothetical protein